MTGLGGRDAQLAARFDARVRTAMTCLIPVHMLAILATALYDQRLVAALAHFAMALMAFVIVRGARDGVRAIIYSHVYWTFSFLTYAYALTQGHGANDGLFAPERSTLVALTSQAGLFMAFILLPAGNDAPEPEGERRRAHLLRIEPLLLGLGTAGMAIKLLHLLPEAYGAALMLLFHVGLAVRILRHAQPLCDGALHAGLALLTAVSVLSNERADLMAALLLFAFAVLMAKERLLTPATLLGAYLGWRLVSIFSVIALSVRAARQAPLHLAHLFAERLFSLETLISVMNPFHTHAAARLFDRQTELSPFFARLGDPADLFARLALLPQMDIVVARLNPASVRWGDLWAILVSALPAVGQEKLLIFSDRVVWDLGLRARDSLGRPMITAEGELFAIGGYAAVFLVIPLCFVALDLGYRLLARLTGSRVVAILIASQLFINAIFSTTLLSVVTQSLREPLQLALVLTLLMTVAARLPAARMGTAP